MPLFNKQILKPGRYLARDLSGKRVEFNVTPERIKHWIESFGKMRTAGLKIPAPWKHDPKAIPTSEASAKDNAGFWEKLWVTPDGSLHGQINVPREEDASRVGTTVQEVSPLVRPEWKDGMGADWQDSISHIALVQKPVDHDQSNFEPATDEGDRLAVAASLGDYEGRLLSTEEPSGKLPTSATAPSIQDVLAALAETGLSLPEDTTFENLPERIVVASKAISGSQDNQDDSQEGKSMPKEQPNPIAMSLEALQKEVGALRKEVEDKTKENKTQAEAATKLKTQVDSFTVLSLEQQKKGYELRISELVKVKKLTPEFYAKVVKPMLGGVTVLSLDDKGKPKPTDLDLVLATLEASPEPDPRLAFLGKGSEVLASLEEQNNPFSSTPEEDDEEQINADADIIAEAGGLQLVK